MHEPLQSGSTVDPRASLILVGYESHWDKPDSHWFNRVDPATGNPIGDCWHWDRFAFKADAGTAERRTYLLFEVPPGHYASAQLGRKKRYAERYDALEWLVDAVPGQVSYFGDLVIDAEGVLDLEHDDGRAADALKHDYPNVNLPLVPAHLTQISTSYPACAP